jgi:hypothetical protein
MDLPETNDSCKDVNNAIKDIFINEIHHFQDDIPYAPDFYPNLCDDCETIDNETISDFIRENINGTPRMNDNNLIHLNNIVSTVNRDIASAKNGNYIQTKLDNPYIFIKNNMGLLINKIEPFTQSPSGTVCFFITRHGGYDITNLKYNIETCEVNNLIRYTYSPKGTCGWSNHFFDINNYKILYDTLNNITNYDEIITKLDILANINKSSKRTITDYHELYNHSVKPLNEKLCKSKNHNRIFLNNLGDVILNKFYETDNKDNVTSGVAILFDITFRLPDIFFASNENIALLDNILTAPWQKYLSKQHNAYYWFNTETGERSWQNPSIKLGFKTGIYNKRTQMITYESNTELVSCPYFIEYVKLTNKITTFNNSKSIVDDLNVEDPEATYINNSEIPTGLKRKMLHYFTSNDIYGYFKYVNTVVSIDYSCGSFKTRNEIDYKNIDESVRLKTTADFYGIHGGKTKKYKKKYLKYKKYKKYKNTLKKRKRKISK